MLSERFPRTKGDLGHFIFFLFIRDNNQDVITSEKAAICQEILLSNSFDGFGPLFARRAVQAFQEGCILHVSDASRFRAVNVTHCAQVHDSHVDQWILNPGNHLVDGDTKKRVQFWIPFTCHVNLWWAWRLKTRWNSSHISTTKGNSLTADISPRVESNAQLPESTIDPKNGMQRGLKSSQKHYALDALRTGPSQYVEN
jgi:hypothetical protein